MAVASEEADAGFKTHSDPESLVRISLSLPVLSGLPLTSFQGRWRCSVHLIRQYPHPHSDEWYAIGVGLSSQLWH